MGEFVRLDVDGGVGTIRLDRPPLNAIDSRVQRDLIELATEVDSRPDVAAVVFYGGQKAFAAGADVKEMAAKTIEEMEAHSGLLQDFTTALAEIGKPTVAAITGFALGGGLEVALTADRRIAADDAKLGQPEILLGIIPGAGGTQRLTRLVGTSTSKELIYTGRFVGAEEALAIGLVDELCPVDQVYDRAVAWASQFVGGPALALRAAKVAIDQGIDAQIADALQIERRQFAGLFATQDQKSGMQSFLENGPGKATFDGR